MNILITAKYKYGTVKRNYMSLKSTLEYVLQIVTIIVMLHGPINTDEKPHTRLNLPLT